MKIEDTKTNDHFGILYFRQDTLDQIYEESKPLSRNNEFQFHYISLVGKVIDPDSKQTLWISIPLVCYNYKQTVSSAHIDFHLKDVENMSNNLMPLATDKANEFLATESAEDLATAYGDIEWIITPFNSSHRHPGGERQAFSGTDYAKTSDNPGIVFPLLNAEEDTANFASIMYVDNDRCKLAHTEIRVAKSNSKNITYKHGRSITFVNGTNKTPTKFETMFNIESNNINNYVVVDGIDKNTTMVSIDFKPDIFIDGKLLSVKAVYNRSFYNNNSFFGNNLFSKNNIELVYDEEVDKLETEKEIRLRYMGDDFDALEVNENDMYIHDPEYMIEMDRNILLDTLRESLDECTGFDITLLNKLDDETIIDLARDNKLLSDPIETANTKEI